MANSSKYVFIAIAGLAIWGGIIAATSSKPTAKKPQSQWTTQQKATLCKQYISGLMGRPTSIMSHYQTDDSGQVYIKYTRTDDGTQWRYACAVDNNRIVWASYLNDTGEWGRWRNEDAAKLQIDSDKKIVTLQANTFTKTMNL